jgi:phosphatidylglycerol lysyltransferase
MHIPVRDLWWLGAGGVSYGARYVKLRWHAARSSRTALRDPTGELLRLHSLYGYSPHSMVSITPGARLWSSPSIDGAIIYSEFGHVWLAVGDPLASAEETCELAQRFIMAARKQRRLAAFVPTTTRFAQEGAQCGLIAVKVGAAPYFDLQTWAPHGDRAKKMRAGVNQACRAGITIEPVATPSEEIKKEVAALCQSWLKQCRTATNFGWLFVLDPFQQAELKRFFAARDDRGRLVAFLAASPIPVRKGWYLEDVVRLPNAPQGTADLLVVEALKRLAAEGAKVATLGTSPLARDGEQLTPAGEYPLSERMLHMTASHLQRFYNFEGVRRFKAKFVPSWWESEYVLLPRGIIVPPRVSYAIIRAIVPGGIPQLITRQIARRLKREQSKRSKGISHS